MFKNRALTVKVDKVGKNQTTDPVLDELRFEQKTDHVLRELESLGAKMFLGVCVYILLDTYRQVKVAQVMYGQGS